MLTKQFFVIYSSPFTDSTPAWGVSMFLKYNLGQKVVDKFTKLSKIGFAMECFFS